MVLKTPKIPNLIDPLGAMLRNLDGNVKDVIVQEGVIISHLNFIHDLKSGRQNFEEYPVFHKDDWMIDFLERSLKQDREKNASVHVIEHTKKELLKYQNVPENVAQLYNKEEWLPVYERKFKWDSPEERESRIRDGDTFDNYEPIIDSYGVCDSPEQLLNMYDFEADPRTFFIKLTEMRKSEQSSWGGWRWHKWGDYIGKQEPTTEYLYDEPLIDNVFVFHIYQFVD